MALSQFSQLSKRERYIAIGVIAAVALFALDRMLLTPFIEHGKQVTAEHEKLATELGHANYITRRQVELGKDWKAMKAGGLKTDPAEAQRQILQSLNEWARECGVNLSHLQPETSPREVKDPGQNKWLQINVHVTGTGPMPAVAKFLWRVETATVPVRISDVQVGSPKEGSADLQLIMTLATLCEIPEEPKGQQAPGAASPRGPSVAASGT